MKTKCEPGDKLKFPDGSEWLFVCYIDENAILLPWVETPAKSVAAHDKPRVTCKCCTPKLHELIIENDPHPTH
jgi:hypothetical protein